MATNQVARGTQKAYLAPVDGVVAGHLVQVEELVVVADRTAAEGETYVGIRDGVWRFDNAAELTASVGDMAYWEPTTDEIEAAATETNIRVGTFYEAVAAEDLTLVVSLDGVSIDPASAAGMQLVEGAVEGNFATFGAAGQVVDGLVAPSDFAAVDHDHDAADITAGAGTVGQILTLVDLGELGLEAQWDDAPQGDGMELVPGATENNIALFDAAGQVKDSLYTLGQFSLIGHAHNYLSYPVIGGRQGATLTLTGNPTDGDTVTLTQGGGGIPVVFEFDNNAATTPGNIPVTIGATYDDTLTALAALIPSNGFGQYFAAADGVGSLLISGSPPNGTLDYSISVAASLTGGIGGWDAEATKSSGLFDGQEIVTAVKITTAILGFGGCKRIVESLPTGLDIDDYLVWDVRWVDDTFAPVTTDATAALSVEILGGFSCVVLTLDTDAGITPPSDGDTCLVRILRHKGRG